MQAVEDVNLCLGRKKVFFTFLTEALALALAGSITSLTASSLTACPRCPASNSSRGTWGRRGRSLPGAWVYFKSGRLFDKITLFGYLLKIAATGNFVQLVYMNVECFVKTGGSFDKLDLGGYLTYWNPGPHLASWSLGKPNYCYHVVIVCCLSP